MLAIVFFASIAALILLMLFFNWYYKTMSHVIFGKMNGSLERILVDGAAPEPWNARLAVLNRKLASGGGLGEKRKKRLVERHVSFIEANMKDIVAYAKRTPFLAEDEREAALAALERFGEETMQSFRDLI